MPEPINGLSLGFENRLTIADVVEVARKRREVNRALGAGTLERVEASARWVKSVVEDNEEKLRTGRAAEVKAYYGINTGFGALAGNTALPSQYHTEVLSRNLVASHSSGTGPYFDEETVRATMLLRAHALAQGYSGVRVELIEKFVDMLNHRIYPAVPQKGSLGASGDLAPLAHLALTISRAPDSTKPDLNLDTSGGEAFVEFDPREGTRDGSKVVYHLTEDRLTGEQTLWRRVSGREAMAAVGGQVVLGAKEGLALNNGTTFSTAVAALALHDARNLLWNAELALAMTLEAIRGFRDPFFPRVHEARNQGGAGETARQVLDYVSGSDLLDPGDEDNDPIRVPPQDPYSIRCAPQVLGSIRATLDFIENTVQNELNAATDNPLIFLELGRDYKSVSCGNFHGEPIAFAMDFLGIVMCELGNIAERRIFKLTDYRLSQPGTEENGKGRQRGKETEEFILSTDHVSLEGANSATVLEDCSLPSFLIEIGEQAAWALGIDIDKAEGLNSGFMIPQYTAAALVSECKTLAHPDSVDSIPSSANKEDHVSMSLNAALHARQIVDNVEAVIAIEIMSAAQALSWRIQKARKEGKTVKLGAGTEAALQHLRENGVPYRDFDSVFYPHIRSVISMIRNGVLVRKARGGAQEVPT
jgi:histidine ammonia-lyase